MKKRWAVGSWQLVTMLLMSVWCCPVGAYAGWFIPENRIAWQAWHAGDDKASLKHWDHSSKGMYNRATVLMSMGHLREAERGFRQALSDAGGLKSAYIASIWYNLGNCLYAEGALKQAEKAWRQVLQYDPKHAKAAHNLAVVEGMLKRRSEQTKNADFSSRMKQKGKRKKQEHHGKRQAEDALSASGKEAKGRQGEYHSNGGKVKSMSQAEQEVNGVHDSMEMFLRHRLAEKPARTTPIRRGPPW